MIGASSRRATPGGPDAGAAFQLHVREARKAALHRRLLHASLAAVVAAAVCFFLPLPLLGRAAATLAAGVLGAAWPPRSGLGAALAHIRGQTGLSYETALDLLRRPEDAPRGREGQAQPVSPDPYGLQDAVIERARLSIRGYESEARPAWWLPALVVAAALMVMPEFIGSPATGAVTGGPAAASPENEALVEAEQAPQPDAPEPPAPGRAEPPAAGPGQDREGDDAPVSELPDGDEEGQSPMSRYLNSLRERPPASGAPTDGSDGAEETAEADREGDERSSEAGEGDRSGSGDRTQSESEEGSEGSPPTVSDAESGSQEGESSEESEDGEGSQGSETAEVDGREGEPGMEPGTEQLDEGQNAEGSSDEGNDPLQAGRGQGDPDSETEGSQSAGLGGGEPGEELLDPQGAGGEQEQLPGVLQDGPETVAGSVRLPGSDEVQLPPGRSRDAYQAAAEEAISEGDLPLDYQEIIRRYFR